MRDMHSCNSVNQFPNGKDTECYIKHKLKLKTATKIA